MAAEPRGSPLNDNWPGRVEYSSGLCGLKGLCGLWFRSHTCGDLRASPRPRRPPRPSPPRQGLQLRRPQPPQRQQGPPLPQWPGPLWVYIGVVLFAGTPFTKREPKEISIDLKCNHIYIYVYMCTLKAQHATFHTCKTHPYRIAGPDQLVCPFAVVLLKSCVLFNNQGAKLFAGVSWDGLLMGNGVSIRKQNPLHGSSKRKPKPWDRESKPGMRS